MALITYSQMQTDLALTGMGQLLNTDFGALLNRAQSEEVDSYDWSFILTNSVIYSLAPYSTGTVSCAQGSATVTGVGTNWTTGFAGYQIRFGSSGMLLPILSVQSATQLTLSVPYAAPAVTDSPYTISQSYYPIPNAKEVTSVRQVFPLAKMSREALNIYDPQRLSIGGSPCTTYADAPYVLGTLQIELWPIPSAAVPYVVEYRQTAMPMVNPTDIPMVPAAVLEAKAMMYVCQSLLASSGDARWAPLASQWKGTYEEERDRAQYSDAKRTLAGNQQGDADTALNLYYLPSHDPY